MTVNGLQHELIKEIERLTRGMSLVNRRGDAAAFRGYPQAIPIFPAEPFPYDGDGSDGGPAGERDLFPYFIVRVDSVEYQKADADGRKNLAHVMVAFAVYDDDPGMKGFFTLTAVMERVAMRFQEDTALGAFFCSREMSVAYQEDDTFPQFFGAMEMTWDIPDICMEVMD